MESNFKKDYPGVSSFKDRHGKIRYRYRRKGRSAALQGEPYSAEFNEGYNAAVEGRERRKASVVTHPNRLRPKTFGAAWRLVQQSPEWFALGPDTQLNNVRLIEKFLNSKLAPGSSVTWKEILVSDLKRRHVKKILSDRKETPHRAKHLLTAIRRMVTVALDEEWIENDPTHKVKWSPKTTDRKAWSIAEVSRYMQHWSPGSNARTVFSVALWLGLRRKDVSELRWSDINFIKKQARIVDVAKKDNRSLILKMAPNLIADLMAINNRGEYVLSTFRGEKFSEKSLSNSMQEWTKAAGIESGRTIHGLRKTLGKWATEGGATTRMAMDLLGHDDIEHVELYSRQAEQERLAADALDCALDAFERHMANHLANPFG